LAQPQAGSAAQPQAGSAAQPQAGSQQSLHDLQRLHSECRRQWRRAKQSRIGVPRQHLWPQHESAQPQLGSAAQPQAGSAAQPQAGSAAQPQAGSAAAQVASQQAGVSQQPLPIMRFSKPNALASDDATKRAATATTGKIIRFMGRTPVPLRETLTRSAGH
jgi:hypothetical protein